MWHLGDFIFLDVAFYRVYCKYLEYQSNIAPSRPWIIDLVYLFLWLIACSCKNSVQTKLFYYSFIFIFSFLYAVISITAIFKQIQRDNISIVSTADDNPQGIGNEKLIPPTPNTIHPILYHDSAICCFTHVFRDKEFPEGLRISFVKK